MRQFLQELFLENIPRKLVAILTAIIIFFFVNQSLTVTKVVNNVSIRLINIPPQKTVEGLLPNGYSPIKKNRPHAEWKKIFPRGDLLNRY